MEAITLLFVLFCFLFPAFAFLPAASVLLIFNFKTSTEVNDMFTFTLKIQQQICVRAREDEMVSGEIFLRLLRRNLRAWLALAGGAQEALGCARLAGKNEIF